MKEFDEIRDEILTLIDDVYRKRDTSVWEKSYQRVLSYDSLLEKKLPDWPRQNLTDLEHGGSTAFAFLLHPGHFFGVPTRDGVEARINRLGGECFQALLEISHIGPYARIRFTKETFNRTTKELGFSQQDNPFRTEDYHFLNTLRLILEEENIHILDREILDELIPDLELDVTSRGNVTIYHCLFDEE